MQRRTEGYQKQFSNPKVDYMADLRMGLMFHPDVDIEAEIEDIQKSLENHCYTSAMNFGCYSAFNSKYDHDYGFRIEMLQDFWSKPSSYFAKAVNIVKEVKNLLLMWLEYSEDIDHYYDMYHILDHIPDSSANPLYSP